MYAKFEQFMKLFADYCIPIPIGPHWWNRYMLFHVKECFLHDPHGKLIWHARYEASYVDCQDWDYEFQIKFNQKGQPKSSRFGPRSIFPLFLVATRCRFFLP